MTEPRTPAGTQEERVIPASRRADGSLRKERRIRAGFVAMEERPKYVPPAARRRAQAAGSQTPNTPESSKEEKPDTKSADDWPALQKNVEVDKELSRNTYKPRGKKADTSGNWRARAPAPATAAKVEQKDEGDLLAVAIQRVTLNDAKDKAVKSG